MYDVVALGKKVKFFRKQKKFSQKELAKQIKASQSNISNLEHGKNKFNIDKLSEIAHALDVTLDDLLRDSLVVHQNSNKDTTIYDMELKNLIASFNNTQLLKTLHFLEYYHDYKLQYFKNI